EVEATWPSQRNHDVATLRHAVTSVVVGNAPPDTLITDEPEDAAKYAGAKGRYCKPIVWSCALIPLPIGNEPRPCASTSRVLKDLPSTVKSTLPVSGNWPAPAEGITKTVSANGCPTVGVAGCV